MCGSHAAQLLGCDGVIRHFDPKYVRASELKHGLAAGTLEGIAFAKPLIEEATAGRITRADWVSRVSAMAGSAPVAEIAALGIADRFDAIFNSADIGFVKPDVRAFEHVRHALGVAAVQVFFTDDLRRNLLAPTSSRCEPTYLRASTTSATTSVRQASKCAGPLPKPVGFSSASHGEPSLSS